MHRSPSILRSLSLILIIAILPALAQAKSPWTSADDPELPVDFKLQGEYTAEKIGAQVIALSNGAFQVVVLPGGLPGDGWDGKNKILLEGALDGEKVALKAAEGKKKYLGNSAAEFSATRQFPPVGQKAWTGVISDGTLTLSTDDGKTLTLKKTIRKSSTLGAKPPTGAIVLFDGTSKDEWNGGRLDAKTKLLNTDGQDITTKRKFNSYTMHLEFMLPFKPEGRGQGRGNSGFYQVDMYEVQVLDSFGLDGVNNECGGIYSKQDSLVNMCYPPLSWQTYDVDFTNAAVDAAGKKTKGAIITLKLNGVLVHDKYEITGKTGGARQEPEGTPGLIRLQGHGNPLQYRNVWIVEK
ncbi:MAG: DUF1080 domain-containing protein [Phycisphaeraceae bacterium]